MIVKVSFQLRPHHVSSDSGVEVLADIPLDSTIMEGADEGRPIVISSASDNPLVIRVKCFLTIKLNCCILRFHECRSRRICC